MYIYIYIYSRGCWDLLGVEWYLVADEMVLIAAGADSSTYRFALKMGKRERRSEYPLFRCHGVLYV